MVLHLSIRASRFFHCCIMNVHPNVIHPIQWQSQIRFHPSYRNIKMTENPSNWAGNYTYHAAKFHQPETVEQIQGLVSRSNKLKALGTRHSFNDIADSPGDLISLERFDKIVALDHGRRSLTVEAGVRYGQLARWLHREGYALHNLASLPHISVAGACATATHGSGDRNGNLATAALALEVINANGELLSIWREGIINQVWLKRHVPDGVAIQAEPELFGARLATKHLHPIGALSAENCTEQMGVCGPWFERLPHFRLEFTPSSGEELQSEYILPRQHVIAAFHVVDQLREYIAPLLQISEIRTIAADSLWMS